MAWMSQESVKAWYDLLPEDMASCMEEPKAIDTAAEALTSEIEVLSSGADVLDFVEKKATLIMQLDRPRRLRFLAWIAGSDYPDWRKVIQALTKVDETAGGDAGGVGKVAPFFKSDIIALAASLGPRVANSIVDGATLNAIRGAGLEVSSELELRGGL